MTPLPDTWNDYRLARMQFAGAAYCRQAGPGQRSFKDKLPSYRRLHRSFAPGALDRLGDQAARFLDAAPALQLHPFAGLEVLVVQEEMLDLMPGDLRQVGVRLHVDVALGDAG